MDKLTEFFAAWESLDFDTLVGKANEAIEGLAPVCKEIDPDHDGKLMRDMLVLMAVFADQEINDAERKMMKQVADLEEDDIVGLVAQFEALTDKLQELQTAQAADQNAAGYLMMLILAFTAADGTINEKERAYLREFVG